MNMPARLIVIAMLLCIAVTGGLAANASAATYHAFVCRIPYGPGAGTVAPTEGVTGGREGPPAVFNTGCAADNASSMSAEAPPPILVGIGASVTYAPGPGITISSFRLWRAARAVGSVFQSWDFVSNIYDSADPVSFDGMCFGSATCIRGTTASPLDPSNLVASAPALALTSVGWQAYCGGVQGVTCPADGTSGSFTRVYAADMLLDDPTPPAVGVLSGQLVGSSPVSGTQNVAFPASDGQSGVFRGRLLVDDKVAADRVLDGNGGACADLGVAPDARPSYVLTHPCRGAVAGTLALDTSTVSVGSHTLRVVVTDAAGNEAASATRAFTVTRDPAAGTVPKTGPNGTGASRSAKLTARLAGARKGVRTLSFTRQPILGGRLLDEHGAAITGAVVEIRARQRKAGGRTKLIATAATGADGRFRVTLPSGPSRTITVSYTAFGEDTKPSATVRTRTAVHASLTASVSPRSPRARRPMRLSGRLRYLPRGDVVVTIQARNHGIWQTADTVETHRDGSYSWPHRFRADQAGRRFFFRARVKSPNYPFEPGTSPTIAVRVRV
jgi:hypothetical protein